MQENGSVVGPDVCVRLNYRVWRFVKSYLRFIPWRDWHYYLQAQAYWISANLKLHSLLGDDRFVEAARACAAEVFSRQTQEGYWEFPKNEWKGRVATVEGCFGSLALLWSGEPQHIEGAKRWYDFLVQKIGFQEYDGESLAVNYFLGVPKGMVPNNSTLALWFFAELARATGDEKYLEYARPLVNFLTRAQLQSGELPYALPGNEANGRTHFLCYQYNAFQLLDLANYFRVAQDKSVERLIEKLGRFLSNGLTPEGAAKKDCFSERPEVIYYTVALAAALLQASIVGLGDYVALAEKSYGFALSRQRPDGGFDFSYGDYGLLADRRQYPLRLAMILEHLLKPALVEKADGRHEAAS